MAAIQKSAVSQVLLLLVPLHSKSKSSFNPMAPNSRDQLMVMNATFGAPQDVPLVMPVNTSTFQEIKELIENLGKSNLFI